MLPWAWSKLWAQWYYFVVYAAPNAYAVFTSAQGIKQDPCRQLQWLELNIDNRMLLLTAACSIHHELKANRLTSRRWIAFTGQIKRICHVIGKEKRHDVSSSGVLWEGGSSVSWYFSNMAWGPYCCMNMRQWYVTYCRGSQGDRGCVEYSQSNRWLRMTVTQVVLKKEDFSMSVKSSRVDSMNDDHRSHFRDQQ